METFDAVVVGGGPAGATAATDLARKGLSVLLLDRGGRIKPCGGAIPPSAMVDFEIPASQLVARIGAAEIVGPTFQQVCLPITRGFIGMVDRCGFDEWLRQRAAAAGAVRRTGTFVRFARDRDGMALVHYTMLQPEGRGDTGAVRARTVIGADGAQSAVGRQTMRPDDRVPYVFAYHEVISSPPAARGRFDPARCDIHYRGTISPDFYGWVFPHGATTSVGVGSAHRGFSLRRATALLRRETGLEDCATLRREGAPIPLKSLRRWDNGRDVVLAGDAAGVVAPTSGEGIYYAMTSGRLAAEAVAELCRTGNVRALRTARNRFGRAHGWTFRILWLLQKYCYTSDSGREDFVAFCRNPNIQRVILSAYMDKRRPPPLALT